MNNYIITNLVKQEGLVVDHIVNSSFNANGNLCITFTPHLNTILDGLGFGGNFLLNHGFDILTFKSSRDDWYQSIGEDVLKICLDIAEKYKVRLAYGSSMGGYAAILFSKFLKIQRALVFSPQISIWSNFDERWILWAKKINKVYDITSESVSDECKFYIVYDSRSLDRYHFFKISELINNENLIDIPLPFCGHPVTHFLSELGALKNFSKAILLEDERPSMHFYKLRRKSTSFLSNFSRFCRQKSKFDLALIYVNSALAIDSLNVHLYLEKANIFKAIGSINEAISSTQDAVSVAPSNHTKAHMYAHLSALLLESNQYESSLQNLLLAEELLPCDPYFKIRLSQCCLKIGNLESAKHYGKLALHLDPENPNYQRHCSDLAWI